MKRIFGMMLCMLAAVMLCGFAWAEGESAIIASGDCGTGVSWELDSSGTLTVSGVGSMADYHYSNRAPWYDMKDTLRHVVIEEGVNYIGSYAFQHCVTIETVVLPEGIEAIGESAFYDCNGLTCIEIPEGVTYIGRSAFMSTGLTDVSLPQSLEYIDINAFCCDIPEIVLPDNITFISKDAFNHYSDLTIYCKAGTASASALGLTSFDFLDTACPEYVLRQLTDESGRYGIRLQKYLGSDNEVVLPDTVRSVPVTALGETFKGLSDLTGVVIPGSVTSLYYTFSGCSGLTQINLPEGVTDVRGAFSGCTGLTEIDLPAGVTEIGGAFHGCSELISIDIPDGVTGIGAYTFYECSNLERIGLPSEMTSVGQHAFSYCGKLESLAIPEKVQSIDRYAFYFCTGMKEMTLPDNIGTLNIYAFSGCGSADFVLYCNAGSVTASRLNSQKFIDPDYPEYLLAQKKNTDGVFSLSLQKYIGTGVSAEIPSSIGEVAVTAIEEKAFYGCGNLCDIHIPDSVVSIGNNAFTYCTGLTEVSIPDSVTAMGSAFSGCTALTKVRLPAGMTTISGFNGCTSLREIDIPETVASIDGSAFRGCSALKKIDLPDNVVSIDQNAFDGCTGLTYIDIPEGVSSIGVYAFSGCTGLIEADLPDGLNAISEGIFVGCTALKSIEIPEGTAAVGRRAFQGCSSLTHAVIPESLTALSENMFAWCDNLSAITLHDGIASIDASAFTGCGKLEHVVILGDEVPAFMLNLPAGFTVYCREFSGTDYWAAAKGYPLVYLDNMDMSVPIDFSLSVRNSRIRVGARETAVLSTFPVPNGDSVLWASSAPEVARVKNGVICALSEGRATITAAMGGRTASVDVEVYLAADGFDFPKEIWVIAKETCTAALEVYPAGGQHSFSISCDSDKIAVSNQGNALEITGRIPGDAVLTVAESVSGMTRNCTVHVFYPVTEVEFENRLILLREAQSAQLTAHVTARTQSAVNRLVDFSSSDESTAVVSLDGVITAVAPGTAVITAAASSGVSAKCTVVVHDGEMLRLPGGLLRIRNEAFAGIGASQIVIPDGVERIGNRAFANCGNLTLIIVPDTVYVIAGDAFEGSGNVTFVCSPGSAAAAYAAEHGIPCIDG